MNPLTNGRLVKIDCPISEYIQSRGDDKAPILSRSDLAAIASNPRKWKDGPRQDDRRTWQTDFGSLFDCFLTQQERFTEYYKVAPKLYDNSKKQTVPWTWKSSTCRDWREEQEQAGFQVCTEEDIDTAKKAVTRLFEEDKEQMQRLFSTSKFQVFCMADYHDEDTGIDVTVKTMTDIVPALDNSDFPGCLVDIKTARSAAPRVWRWQVFECGYHIQAAMNLDVFTAATKEERNEFRHVIVENEPPFECARRFVTEEFLNLGRETYLLGLKRYCQCVKTGEWPGYITPFAMVRNGFEE